MSGDGLQRRLLSGDCANTAGGEVPQLVGTYRNETAHVAETHYMYLTMLDDLKSELDMLCTEVTGVHHDYKEQDDSGDAGSALTYETSVQEELLLQNDLLQQALERATKEQSAAHLEMSKTNESLKCQIEQLQCTVAEKEQCIVQLQALRAGPTPQPPTSMCSFCRTVQGRATSGLALRAQQERELEELRTQLNQARERIETLLGDLERSQKQERQLHGEQRKLNDELLDSKRKNNDVICHTRRLAALLKTQEMHRMDLSQKFEQMEQNYCEQSKKLHAANSQLNLLHDRFNQTEKRNDEQHMERNLLREEVLALKEKEACLTGKVKSIQEHLVKTECELYKAHDVIKEQRCILQRNDDAHKEIVQHLQAASDDIKRQLDSLLADYKQLQRDYKKQDEVCAQNDKIIESFRKWKEAQLLADADSRDSFKQYEEHIKLLLEEKQNFIEQHRDLRRDYCILQSEVERLKLCPVGSNASGLSHLDNTMTQRMGLLRQTYQRLAETCGALQPTDGGDGGPPTTQQQQQPAPQQ